MRFVNVATAKGLKIGEQVYTVNSNGEHGVGKLISREENQNGVLMKFEIPQYFNPDAPAIKPIVTVDVTHVCILKNRKVATDDKDQE